VLSHRFWQRRFGADAGLIGKTITLNRHPFTVVGVAARDFNGAELFTPDLWAPITMQAQLMPGRDFLPKQNLSWLEVVGRLKPGVSMAQAQAEMALFAGQLDLAYPGRKTQVIVAPGNFLSDPERREIVIGFAALLLAAVGLVLLIACANVANLSLSRAVTRQKEIAVRLALGASRLRLVRQLLTESVLIATLGGALGLLLAYWTVDALLAATRLDQTLSLLDISPDVRIFGYTFLVSVLTGLTFGLAPALQSTRPNLASTLKDEGAAIGQRFAPRARLRDLLIVAQVTVCLALLVTAGLLLRGLQRAQTLDPGFRTDQALVAKLDLRQQGYDQSKAAVFHQRLIERLGAMPGVKSVSLASITPFDARNLGQVIPEGSSQEVWVDYNAVSPRYFETLGIPLLQGRDFSEQEMKEQAPVAVINEAMARTLWPDEQALGKRFKSGYSVIGVVKSVRSARLARVDGPYVYYPIKPADQLELRLMARVEGDPRALIGPLQEAVREVEPRALVSTATLAEFLEGQIAAPRAAACALWRSASRWDWLARRRCRESSPTCCSE
jgi:predicted permease